MLPPQDQVDVVIAADVLYDNVVTESFLRTAQKLILLGSATYGDNGQFNQSTQFIVAQKAREEKDRNYFEKLIEGSSLAPSSSKSDGDPRKFSFIPEHLHTEASVHLWSLKLQLQDI